MNVTVIGKPISFREVTLKDEKMVCLGFEENSDSNLKGELNKDKDLEILMTLQQWNDLLQSIVSAGDSITNANEILIKGNINQDIALDVLEGAVGIVCIETKYIKEKKRTKIKEKAPKRENEKNTQPRSNTQSATNNNTEDKSTDSDTESIIVELHKKYNGVCQKCGQRCDKKVISIEKENNKDIIVCPDCHLGKEKPSFIAVENVVASYAEATNIDSNQAKQYLEEFPNKYALISYGKRARVYWTWEKDNKIDTIFVNHKGEIFKYVLKKDRYKKKKNDKKLKTLKKRKGLIHKGLEYIIVKKVEIPVEELKIPEAFEKSNPQPGKVESKIQYYKKHQQFEQAVLVERNDDQYEIIDGYTKYLASKELDLDTVIALYVKKASS